MAKDVPAGKEYTADTIKDHVSNLYCDMEVVRSAT